MSISRSEEKLDDGFAYYITSEIPGPSQRYGRAASSQLPRLCSYNTGVLLRLSRAYICLEAVCVMAQLSSSVQHRYNTVGLTESARFYA